MFGEVPETYVRQDGDTWFVKDFRKFLWVRQNLKEDWLIKKSMNPTQKAEWNKAMEKQKKRLAKYMQKNPLTVSRNVSENPKLVSDAKDELFRQNMTARRKEEKTRLIQSRFAKLNLGKRSRVTED